MESQKLKQEVKVKDVYYYDFSLVMFLLFIL